MDENQVHLFKAEAAVDHVWENQKKHLEASRSTGVEHVYNQCSLCCCTIPSVPAGRHRSVEFRQRVVSVGGQKGRKHMVYLSPLVHRLNQQCQELFGEMEEVNYRPPVLAGDERTGLEYQLPSATPRGRKSSLPGTSWTSKIATSSSLTP